jgi:hypothetical protein
VDRLFKSARMLRMTVPVTPPQLHDLIVETAARNGMAESRMGYLRPLLSRGAGPLGIKYSNKLGPATLVIIPQLGDRRVAYTGEIETLTAVFSSYTRPGAGSLDARIKANNYLTYILAFMEAQDRGADVAILRASGLGRSQDLDGDGLYGTSEGLNILQRWSDIMAVVRSVHLGADADGSGGSDLTASPAGTYQFGISYGGQTTLGIAAYDTQVGAAVANVAGSGQFGNGFLTALGTSRESAAGFLSTWQPLSLLNGSDPLWGGGFTEDVPWPGEPLQIGLVAGAEDIQWALDAQQWRDAHQMAADLMPLTESGDARGGAPMPLLYQMSRGDALSANTLQRHLVTSGGLEDRTCLVRFDLEPDFDSQWALFGFEPGTARHMALGLPHSGDPLNLAGRIPDDLRQQLADFLASAGGVLDDPDTEPGNPYSGNVFEVPISPASLVDIASDPGFP